MSSDITQIDNSAGFVVDTLENADWETIGVACSGADYVFDPTMW